MSCRVVTTCETREPYLQELTLMIRSLREWGGELSSSPLTVFAVGEDEEFLSELEKLDCEVQRVSAFDERNPYGNKLAMFQEFPEDWLVGLDTDLIVMRDFSHFLQGNSIQAKAANHAHLSVTAWEELYSRLGMELPIHRMMATSDWKEMPPYLNSGVVIAPRYLVKKLHSAWREISLWLLDQMPSFSEGVRAKGKHVNQYALMLALQREKLPYRELAASMNLSLGDPLDEAFEAQDPYILHHHHDLEPNGSPLSKRLALAVRYLSDEK